MIDLEPARAALRKVVSGSSPRIALVLGSGLGRIVDALERPRGVAFAELPGLPPPSVAGHGGRFVAGRLDGVEVLVQAGRYHAYEGHPLDIVVAPTRLLASVGVEMVVMTNAVGAIASSLEAGSVVLLDDLVNATFRSPLTGPVAQGEVRFPDMSAPFDRDLQAVVSAVARDERIPLARGVYGGVPGPAYETAAEVRMLREMGGDVVGMSTVPDVVAARAAGLRVVGLSLVTNRATGLASAEIRHDDVLRRGQESAETFGRLVRGIVARLGEEGG